MQAEDVKVSIIVPVYNVESYLDKCVCSLVNQTYKNIEILLVDDGSTDACSSMCDDYASRYSNVATFHKKNGGLSSARNFGLKHASGKYISFVDSDDYVDLRYIECLLTPVFSNNFPDKVDVVLSGGFIEEDLDGVPLATVAKGTQKEPHLNYEQMSVETALEEMLYAKKFGVSACAKLFLADIARQFPFPEGRIYEDLATTYKMIDVSKNIVYLDATMYHCVFRSDSIRHSAWSPAANDIILAAQEVLDYVDANCPNIHSAAVYRFFIGSNEIYRKAFYEKSYIKLIAQARGILRKLLPDALKDAKVSAIKKFQFATMVYLPRAYRVLFQCYVAARKFAIKAIYKRSGMHKADAHNVEQDEKDA